MANRKEIVDLLLEHDSFLFAAAPHQASKLAAVFSKEHIHQLEHTKEPFYLIKAGKPSGHRSALTLHTKYYNNGYAGIEEAYVQQLLDPSYVMQEECNFSTCVMNLDAITAAVDYWGVNTYYYYYQQDEFYLSDNIFLLNLIAEQNISKYSMFEMLFFNYPMDNHTFFNNVFSLGPGQRLNFHFSSKKLIISDETDFSKIIEHDISKNYIDAFNEFFTSFAQKPVTDTQKNVAISLSSGSDSRTVLSALLNHELHPQAYVFGSANYLESARVKNLCSLVDVPCNMIELQKGFETFDRDILLANVITHGFLNPLRSHYFQFYGAIPANTHIFHGFFGSELVKGEIATNAMISLPHLERLQRKANCDEIINKYYPEIDCTVRGEMNDYISSTFQDILFDIHAPDGLLKMAAFLFKYEPGKVFSCFFRLMNFFNQHPMMPFLNSEFLAALYKSGYGITHYVSMHQAFPGPIASIKPQAEIVKRYDKRLYQLLLDRNVSFQDSLEKSPSRAKCLRKVRCYRDRIEAIGKAKFIGQIDNRVIEKKIAEELSRSGYLRQMLPNATTGTNTLLNKHLYNLSMISACKF